ncbi:MAG: hypothetical protein V1672_00595 [Candidatus Diapherotrites archaeon]
MNKKSVILDSIKKLIALNVLDEEILLNLKEIGVSESEANDLISEAKGIPVKKKEQEEIEKDSGKVMRDVAINLAEASKDIAAENEISEEEAMENTEEIVAGLDDLEEDPKPKKKTEKTIHKSVPKSVQKPKPVPHVQAPQVIVHRSVNLNKLWEKGILVTVDQKVHEMKKLREEIDAILDAKIKASVDKGLMQEKLIFESQQKLMADRVNSKLDSKVGEITEIIDTKIREMKTLNESVRNNMHELERKEAQYKATFNEIESKMSDLQNTKQKLVQDLTADMIRNKSDAQEFLENATSKMQEIDERVSRTLELESNIAEGVVKDANDKIDQLALEKTEQIKAEIDVEMQALRILRDKVNPERINKQLDTFEEISKRLAEEQKIVFKGLDSRVESKLKAFDKSAQEKLDEKEGKLKGLKELAEYKIDQAMQEHKTDYEKIVSDKLDELDSFKEELLSEIDPDSFKIAMKDLELFKQQFVKVIENNVGKFNNSINALNEQSKNVEKQINLRIKKIDQKMAELDDFEKTFAEEMGFALDKVSQKKSEKKAKKK